MKTKNRYFYFTILLLLVFSQETKAQVEVFFKNALEKISEGHSHLVVSDLNSTQANEFLQVYKKYWILTKGIDIIDADSLQQHLVAGDSYFSLETSEYVSREKGTTMFYYLNLWIPKERALKKPSKFDINDEISIARIQLSVHAALGKRLHWPSFNDGDINNWNPGILKNYLQHLTIVLKTGKKFIFDDVTNKTELKFLKSQTLYCPEDDFYTIGGFFAKTGKFEGAEVDNLFKGYKSGYKVITSRELGDKILADNEQFYYFLYLGTFEGRIMLVVNSRTGELLYSRTKQSFSINLKSGDLKDLYSEIR